MQRAQDGWKIEYAAALGRVHYQNREVESFHFLSGMMHHHEETRNKSPQVAYYSCIRHLVNENLATQETIFAFIRDTMNWYEVIRQIQEMGGAAQAQGENYNLQ